MSEVKRRVYLVTLEGADEKLIARVAELAASGGFTVTPVDEAFDAAWASRDPRARLVSRRSEPLRTPKVLVRLVADAGADESTLGAIRELGGVRRVELLPEPLPAETEPRDE